MAIAGLLGGWIPNHNTQPMHPATRTWDRFDMSLLSATALSCLGGQITRLIRSKLVWLSTALDKLLEQVFQLSRRGIPAISFLNEAAAALTQRRSLAWLREQAQ